MCWNQLGILHDCLPRQYRVPGQVYIQMQLEIYP
ncbi:DUF3136 domain-containing protein [Cyanobium sp. Cruz-8D1]|nr:DUF3136 domain-containing protein [Cyanobium sp. Cruz-8H5]MCP9867881.1 DUF3136 domain-containing protein [Cyanobium sp. Cruz-8D1]